MIHKQKLVSRATANFLVEIWHGVKSSPRAYAFPALFLALLLTACEEEGETAEVIRPVRAIKLADVEGFASHSFPGRAAATQEINAAFRISGQLIQRPIQIGQEIKKGELIAALDPSTFQAEVDRLTAEVSSSEATLERAVLELNRQTKLLEGGWVTQARVDTVQATESSSRASVLASKAALQRARLDLSFTTLTAPFDGVVVETFVENFQEVAAKQPIARIVDTSQIDFWIAIPENLISLAPYVRDIEVEFDAFPGQPLPAQIKEIKNEASETTRAFDVNLLMDQPDTFTVLPGMAGKASKGAVDLPDSAQSGGIEVPLGAIHNPGGDENYVWVIDEASMKVARRKIEVVEITDRGMRIQGARAGEWVASAGVDYLREGQRVRFAE